MKQALILCGGKAKRLEPLSQITSKVCMDFLNLPLLSLSWFYLEQLGVSRFLLNSHAFPKKLEETTQFLRKDNQKVTCFFEEKPLGASGTLKRLEKKLNQENFFFYINGDSLFFPSDRNQLSLFLEDFLRTKTDISFFVSPLQSENSNLGALYCDSNFNLKFIGKKQDLDETSIKLKAFHFSGLALFKSSILNHLKSHSYSLFKDGIKPLLSTHKIKVFLDKSALILEAGEKNSYLKSMNICLKALFLDKENPIKDTLQKLFVRFDSRDEKVGLMHGKFWSQKLNQPLLAPKSIKGLENLTLYSGAVLGAHVNLYGKSQIQNSVVGSGLSWKGNLKNEILLNPN